MALPRIRAGTFRLSVSTDEIRLKTVNKTLAQLEQAKTSICTCKTGQEWSIILPFVPPCPENTILRTIETEEKPPCY